MAGVSNEIKLSTPSGHHGPGIFKRLASRVHSGGDARQSRHQSKDHADNPGRTDPSQMHDAHENDVKQDTSLYERARSHAPSFSHPSFKTGRHGSYSSVSASPPSSKKRSISSHKNRSTPEACLSRELWEEAYDSLRHDSTTRSLVVTYEAIVSQELPDELKAVTYSILSPPDGDTDRRLELMTAIATAGLSKRRGSKASQVEDVSRLIPECSKRAVAMELDEFPAAALAWSGFCTLTPVSPHYTPLGRPPRARHADTSAKLMIDPILRHDEFRRGLVHIIGRISWYMSIVRMLSPSWSTNAPQPHVLRTELEINRARARDDVVRAYRRLLEFEMNCVCASASAWNQVARNVVRWNSIGKLVDQVYECDDRLRELLKEHMAEGTHRQQLCAKDADLDIDFERESRIEEECGEETGPSRV